VRAARGIGPQLTTGTPLDQRTQLFAGALLPKIGPSFRQMYQQRKTLDGHCWLC